MCRVVCRQLESESLIPRLMHARCPDFSFQRTKFDQDNSKAGTGRRAVGALLAPRVSCYTLEVSFYAATIGYTGVSGKGSNHEVYTQDNCTWRGTVPECALAGHVTTYVRLRCAQT